jgi:hypothetical protein
MGKLKRLELWWQLYVTSLPERDVRNIRPLDFCWTVSTTFSQTARRTSYSKLRFVSRHGHRPPPNLPQIFRCFPLCTKSRISPWPLPTTFIPHRYELVMPPFHSLHPEALNKPLIIQYQFPPDNNFYIGRILFFCNLMPCILVRFWHLSEEIRCPHFQRRTIPVVV